MKEVLMKIAVFISICLQAVNSAERVNSGGAMTKPIGGKCSNAGLMIE